MATPASTVPARVLDIKVAPRGASTVNGVVHVDVEVGGAFRLTVTLHGLPSNTRQVINMHGGTCAAEDSSPNRLIRIGLLSSNAAGDGVLSVDHPNTYTLLGPDSILTVHGPDNTDGAFGHVACAEMAP